MTETSAAPSTSAERPADGVHRLRPNAIGLVGVLFMSVATAAPITAMVGNVPIAVGFGNGAAAPAGYMVATVVLTLFAIGYAAMSKHITATGAFYGYISHGLGRVIGLSAGMLTTLAYMVFEASLVGIFAFFCSNLVQSLTGASVPWIVFAVIMLVANATLTYFDVNVAAKILGVFLVTEVLMLAAMAVSVLVRGGGPEGWSWASLNPLNAFVDLSGSVPAPDGGSAIAVAGSAGIGLFFAFWSWVGFESSAMYGEESRNPKKIIPIAVIGSVVGIGIFYVLVSWLAIVGVGPQTAIALAQDSATSSDIFFRPVGENLGQWAVIMFQILLATGSFACGMAFHNSASRYLYALGREDILPGLARTLGRTHSVHGSPHVAGFVQSIVATLIVVAFFVTGQDPYGALYGLMAILGTSAIMIVQAVAAIAVIGYFHVRGAHPETKHWFRTLVAPALGAVGMIYVVFLLVANAEFAAGTAAGSPVFAAIPYIVGGVALLGVVWALVLKKVSPQRFARLGRVILDEAKER
ncbi:APC family permease [Microbacterium sp. SORGH_AS_0888]|uniref:APC family permease n=1 Tax=Microbacterium sp. SORGH_AS_0888 TaxID=3041791 RepID=UPI00278AB116|nr:APC family permease [Microbacterium sp. SORGH_AS_0888]MDQ1128347.1 amino acid transporter [Microbacterium sp. SORGH_AS_0888]